MKPQAKTAGRLLAPAADDLEPLAGPAAGAAGDEVAHGDVVLAAAAAAGDPAALAALGELISRTGAALIRLGLTDAARDDVLQELRLRLLVPGAGGGRGIASYAGTGSLAGWLTVCAVNLGRRRAAQADRQPAAADPGELDADAAGGDLELDYMRRLYGAEFRRAFEHAFATLSARQRNLLRYTVLDRLTAEQVAAIYSVHRTTVARELSRIRKELHARTRAALVRRLGLSAGAVESVLLLLDSQLHVTLERLVAREPP
jgi:RNA polymerase sigma-70 factor (ECF subfamily)